MDKYNTHSNQALYRSTIASTGCPEHPSHAQFHLIRLLIGSLIGGWTIMLTFMVLGFLGTFDFTQSAVQAFNWVLIGGTILGIVLGAVFGAASAILVNIIPSLRRCIHPLALVRIGFIALIFWPLIALFAWPSSALGFYIAPIIVFLLAWVSLAKNPHAELIPHSTTGRILGTSAGPFVIMVLMLIVIIPIFNRGYGRPQPPNLIMVAVDGVDGAMFYQLTHTENEGRYPNLEGLVDGGTYGVLSSTAPFIPEQIWANLMTGTEVEGHGIIDIHSTSSDFTGLPLWEILSLYDNKVGLFQVPPPHHEFESAAFDVPPPESIESTRDPLGIVLAETKNTGGREGLPNLFRSAYLACLLARHGVRLDTFDELLKQYLEEILLQPSWKLVYQDRKFLEFRIETDCALALLRKNPVDAAFLRFPAFSPLFFNYWRYAKPNEFLPPPPEIDAALAAGLGMTIPQVYKQLDEFVGRLSPFRDRETILAIVSNHGIRSASDRRNLQLALSPERLADVTGNAGAIVGDISGNGICVRAVDPDQNEEIMDELERSLRTAMWVPAGEETDTRRPQRTVFDLNRYPQCLEISVSGANGPSANDVVTIGEWEGPLSGILAPGEPPSGMASANGLMLLYGYPFKPGGMASGPTVFDVPSTLLHALDIDISGQMMGRSMEEIFDPGWLTDNPVRYIDTYEVPEPLAEEEPEESVQESVAPGEPFDRSVQTDEFTAGVVV